MGTENRAGFARVRGDEPMLIEIDASVILRPDDRERLAKIQRWTPETQIELAKERSALLEHLPLWTIHRTDERNFSRALMGRFYFEGCNLIGANFRGAYLFCAGFRGCSLMGANFSWSSVKPEAFYACDLSGADFTGAIYMADPPMGWRWKKGTMIAQSLNEPEGALCGGVSHRRRSRGGPCCRPSSDRPAGGTERRSPLGPRSADLPPSKRAVW